MEKKRSVGVTIFGILFMLQKPLKEWIRWLVVVLAKGGVKPRIFFKGFIYLTEKTITEPLYPGGLSTTIIVYFLSLVSKLVAPNRRRYYFDIQIPVMPA